MRQEGPSIDRLTHWLAECPQEFQEEPQRGNTGTIDVEAIVCDCFRHLRSEVAIDDVLPRAAEISTFSKLRQKLIAIATWLLNEPWFVERPQLAPQILQFLLDDRLDKLSGLVNPDKMISDPDRREELARVCLNALGFRPHGESREQAQDRLTTLDSVERSKMIQSTRAAEARARQIREQMASRAAQEAAARFSPE